MPLLASILICTRNRAAYLGSTICAAVAQTLPSGDFEIVVVDNGSTDRTPEVVRECQAVITKVSLRYIIETEVGLSAARNRALREAKGQILCFLDDDAVPEPEWLAWLVRGYEGNSRVMCVGGAIMPVYEITLPVWFSNDLELIFKPKIRGIELHRVTYPLYPYGANISIRAEAVRLVGMFNPSLGYKGRNLIPCEETEFLLRLEKAGYDILMETRAVVKHIIPATRLARANLRLRYYANGQGCALMNYLHCPETKQKTSTFSQVHKLAALAVRIFRLQVRYLQQRVLYQNTMQPELFLHQCRLAANFGHANQEWKIRWRQFWGRPLARYHLGANAVSKGSS